MYININFRKIIFLLVLVAGIWYFVDRGGVEKVQALWNQLEENQRFEIGP